MGKGQEGISGEGSYMKGSAGVFSMNWAARDKLFKAYSGRRRLGELRMERGVLFPEGSSARLGGATEPVQAEEAGRPLGQPGGDGLPREARAGGGQGLKQERPRP